MLYLEWDKITQKKDPSPKTQISSPKTYSKTLLGIWSLVPMAIGMRLNECGNLSRFKFK